MAKNRIKFANLIFFFNFFSAKFLAFITPPE